jgi:LysM repeat protein
MAKLKGDNTMKKTSKKTSKKSAKKTIKKNYFFYFTLAFLTVAVFAVCGILGNVKVTPEEVIITPAAKELPAIIEGDQGEVIEIEGIPTYDEVDGGQFLDINEMQGEGDYSDLGWNETYNVSSPEAFKNDTLNKCIYANNYYGAQCVSLARVFWWSYADRDVSTCGTGMAKGMMNCADENAGNDFLIKWEDAKYEIQAGDWLVFNGGKYGHVCMSLGGYNNGYIACLGENQGGTYCEKGGAATNIINLSLKNLIGYYRPKSYVKPEPTPEPQPIPDEPTETYVVKKGDTLGSIARKLNWYTGDKLFGDDGYCQLLAEFNGIEDRGLIYPNQIIRRK